VTAPALSLSGVTHDYGKVRAVEFYVQSKSGAQAQNRMRQIRLEGDAAPFVIAAGMMDAGIKSARLDLRRALEVAGIGIGALVGLFLILPSNVAAQAPQATATAAQAQAQTVAATQTPAVSETKPSAETRKPVRVIPLWKTPDQPASDAK